MSAEHRPYNLLFLQAWAILSVVVSAILFCMFLFGTHLLHAGNAVWDLLRWLASPFI